MSNLKSTIKFEDLKKLLISALQEFYDNDAILFSFCSGAVAERCMVFRIGHYMQNLIIFPNEALFRDLVLDCEYNRHGECVKMVDGPTKGIPDLLIHQRKNDNNNILCIEFKKKTASSSGELADEKKLEIFTSESHEYKYLYGFHIHLDKQGATVAVYKDGKKNGCDDFCVSGEKSRPLTCSS